ncbi:MAG: hypothetical protein A2Z37_06535 [Chloroflexi bacterium RBG_19FT_COMBO_62_14]|nr:MAG: hypothetical protein A2Z37_06535 [Chloroflexi bacterium RBG_19FT_COMBO_62_14]
MTPGLVECHSGGSYAERPIAFEWEDVRLLVAEVLGRWRYPEGFSFRVLTEDGRVFDLHHLESDDVWQIALV